MEPIVFRATAVRGSDRGRRIGVPTVNLAMEDVPKALRHGIYACRCRLDGETMSRAAAMHYGPRPAFKDTDSCEIHLLDTPIDFLPGYADVEVVGYIREVLDFPSTEALLAQITRDVADARAMLSA